MPNKGERITTHYPETDAFIEWRNSVRVNNKPLSPNTVRMYRETINSFLSWWKSLNTGDKYDAKRFKGSGVETEGIRSTNGGSELKEA